MNPPLVVVVDDDESIRESLPDLLMHFGFSARAFFSPKGFLDSGIVEHTRCLVLDIGMPGMTGPGLKEELARRGLRIPIVFVTGHANASARKQLIDAGAVDVLFKPFADDEFFRAVKRALSVK